MTWRPLEGDLAEIRDDRVAISTALRDAARGLVAAGRDVHGKLGVALATITEMAGLLGDTLRARAQNAVAKLAEPQQRAVLAADGTAGADAKRITAGVEAILDDLSRVP